jgi:hypothetical protein
MKKTILIVLSLFFAASASATRIEVMKWTWSDPSGLSVDGYRIYKRLPGGTFGPAVSMGNPAPDANGVRQFSYTIPETTGDVYFKSTAFDLDREGNKGPDGPECADGATSCTVRWTFAGTGAKKFYVYQRVAPSTTYGPRIDAGLPTPDASGVYAFTVAAPATGVKFNAVSVVTDVESVLSNEICRNTAGQPCQSPPPGAPSQPGPPVLVP